MCVGGVGNVGVGLDEKSGHRGGGAARAAAPDANEQDSYLASFVMDVTFGAEG